MKKTLIAASLLSVLAASNAFANEKPVEMTISYMKNNIKASVGDISGSDDAHGVSVTLSPSLRAGEFGPIVEAHYSHYDEQFGDYYSTTSVDVFTTGIAAGPRYQINEALSLYATVGLNYTMIDATTAVYDFGTVSGDDSSFDLTYGAGVQLRIDNSIVFNFGASRSEASFGAVEADMTMLKFGAGWTF